MSGRLVIAINAFSNYLHSFSPVNQDLSHQPATLERLARFSS